MASEIGQALLQLLYRVESRKQLKSSAAAAAAADSSELMKQLAVTTETTLLLKRATEARNSLRRSASTHAVLECSGASQNAANKAELSLYYASCQAPKATTGLISVSTGQLHGQNCHPRLVTQVTHLT